MTTTIDYALMAGAAYRTTRSKINWIPAPQRWTPFFPVPDPTTAAIFPATSGFEAAAFQNGTEIVICWKEEALLHDGSTAGFKAVQRLGRNGL